VPNEWAFHKHTGTQSKHRISSLGQMLRRHSPFVKQNSRQ